MSVPLPTTPRMSLPGRCWDFLQAPQSEFYLAPVLGELLPGFSCPFLPILSLSPLSPYPPSPPKALTCLYPSPTFYSFTSSPEVTIKETPQLCVP